VKSADVLELLIDKEYAT